MATIKTDNLDAILQEIKPGFETFYNKIDQLDQQSADVAEQIETAKAEYDVETLNSLENTVKNISIVREQVVKDLEKHKEAVNSNENEKGSLFSRLREAFKADFAVENAKVQETFTLIANLEQQLVQAKKELADKEVEVGKKIKAKTHTFSRFLKEHQPPTTVYNSTMSRFEVENND